MFFLDFVVFFFLFLQGFLFEFQLFLCVQALVLEEKQLFFEVYTLGVRVDLLVDVVVGFYWCLQLIGHFIHDAQEWFDELFFLYYEAILFEATKHLKTCFDVVVDFSDILQSTGVFLLQLLGELTFLWFFGWLNLAHLIIPAL